METMSLPALLQIAPRFCQPPTAGAEFRTLHLGSRLARRMAVTHAGFLTPNAVAPAVKNTAGHRFVAIPRRGSYRVRDLLRGTIGPVPFSVLNYTRAEMIEAVEDLFAKQSFDIAILEGVHLGGYLSLLRSAECRPFVVCDWHNIESEILQRYSETARGPLRQVYARVAARKLENYERWFVNQCDMHVVVSERDREVLVRRYGSRAPVVVVENGVPLDSFLSSSGEAESRSRFRLLFCGAMDYHANVDAVSWFAAEAWPGIHAMAPEVRFTIVGRNPAPAVQALAGQPGIEVTGTVPNVRPYYGEALAAVVPLRVGGGTRIKILEAMAAGVPVVSTGLGAEGLAAIPDEHYIRADSGEQIRAALTDLLRNPGKAERMSFAARDLVRRRYDWASLGDQLAEHLLAHHGKRAAVRS